MKYWVLIILEDYQCLVCGSCRRPFEVGKHAYILVDTEKTPGRIEWVNCPECMKEKFPEAVSGL